ncbi:MAG: hypothetical protein GKS02_13760 [Alphaproteobacteria bacterium]|nr:hypothetical protein [Alphaproteobacteria bacterium]
MPLSKADLLGAWTLDEWYVEDEDDGRSHPMGRDAQGMIMYTDDGHMSAIVHAKDRFLPADRPTDEDRLEAFTSYIHYAGAWDVDEDNVVHKVEHALDPNIQGQTIVRAVEHDGARMSFTGKAPVGTGTHVIVWKRR